MIRTLLRVLWLGLARDRIALGFTFVLPIAFFSIFAAIFGGMSGGGDGGSGGGLTGLNKAIEVIAVDLDQSEISRHILARFGAQDAIDLLMNHPNANSDDSSVDSPFSREQAVDLVFQHDTGPSAAVVIPKGFGSQFGKLDSRTPRVELIYDATNPFAQYAVSGMLQAVSLENQPQLFEIDSKNARQVVMDEGTVRAASDPKSDRPNAPMMPYYATGIGVMFLLFSMVAAAGSMLKEVETGALERVLSSHVTMTQLLASKWAFYAIVGSLQLFLMFVWGSLLFDIDLWTTNHIVGFWIMTLITAAAASGFGMMMATLCRTRGQLDGISTIVILMMSAVGGSMIPRIYMPDFMQSLSQFTFNGQALNGYLGVFWNEQPGESVAAVISRITPSVCILAVMTIVFFTLSRLLARRWDAV